MDRMQLVNRYVTQDTNMRYDDRISYKAYFTHGRPVMDVLSLSDIWQDSNRILVCCDVVSFATPDREIAVFFFVFLLATVTESTFMSTDCEDHTCWVTKLTFLLSCCVVQRGPSGIGQILLTLVRIQNKSKYEVVTAMSGQVARCVPTFRRNLLRRSSGRKHF